MIGRKADGWIPAGGTTHIDELAALGARIDDAAEAAGRDPRSVRRIVNVMADITGDTAGAWSERLATWAFEPGVDAFVFWPPDAGTGMIERLAAELVPRVREAITRKD